MKNDDSRKPGPCAEGDVFCIFESTAQLLDNYPISPNASSDAVLIIGAVRDLLRALGSGMPDQVEQSLSKLGHPQDSDLFTRVGHMTRSLHEALREFKATLDRDNLTMDTTNIPDAAAKLEKVIALTFEAAHKTMTLIEHNNAKLKAAESRVSVMRKQFSGNAEIQAFLDEQSALFREVAEANHEIIMTQEFQDLTGQALRKVIKLVTELEANLVNLVKIFGGSSASQQPVAPPQTKPGQSDETKMVQDDVDSLLSRLGF